MCVTPDPVLNIPPNCAIVLSLSEMNNKGYINGQLEEDSAYRCASCKPGFKPDYDNKKFINDCVEITNCLVKDFNRCK